MSSQIRPHVSKFIMMQFIPCLRQSGIEDGLRCLTQIAVMLNNRSSCSMSESWREKARDMVCRCKLRKKQIRFFVRRNSSGPARLVMYRGHQNRSCHSSRDTRSCFSSFNTTGCIRGHIPLKLALPLPLSSAEELLIAVSYSNGGTHSAH